MLQIILPVAFIPSTVLMNINSVAICLIVKPFSFENVSVDMPEFSMTTGLVKAPAPLVLSSVFPDLDSVSVLHIAEPLPCIGGSIFKVDFSSFLQLRFVDIIQILHIIWL